MNHRHYRTNKRCNDLQFGFTLIELMIVLAIVAILAAIAMPSYRESVRRGDRASARAALLESQQFMERYYAANDAFDQASLPSGGE